MINRGYLKTKNKLMIKDKIKEITLIIFELEYLKSDLISITNKESYYFDSMIKNSPSFYRIYQNSFKLFVLELYKLLNTKEDFSLITLVNFLITNNVEWKREAISTERLKTIGSKIEEIQHLHLTNIKNLRDKFYAHTDKNRASIKIDFTLNQSFEIFLQLRDYFEEIVLQLNNQKIMFDVLPNIINEITLLQRYKSIEKIIIEELQKGSTIVEIKKIQEIIHNNK